MDFEELEVGNLLGYTGPLFQYRGTIGEILEIDKSNEREIYRLKLINAKGEEKPEIVAYPDGIGIMYLNQKFLLDQGFEFDGVKTYTKDGITIIKVDFVSVGENIAGRKEGLMLEDKGFGVLKERIKDVTNREEILSKVDLLKTVHALQNYYTNVLKTKLEIISI